MVEKGNSTRKKKNWKTEEDMEKNIILENLCNAYVEHNAAQKFIVGVKRFRHIYACIIDVSHLIDICLKENIIEYEPRKQSVRFIYQPNKHKGFNRIIDEAITAFPICAWVDFQNEKKQEYCGQVYNFGDTFERLVHEQYDMTWHKDSVAWWERGDINLEGEEMQIKDASHRATLFATKHLVNNGWI